MLIGYVIRGGMLTNFYHGNQILLFFSSASKVLFLLVCYLYFSMFSLLISSLLHAILIYSGFT